MSRATHFFEGLSVKVGNIIMMCVISDLIKNPFTFLFIILYNPNPTIKCLPLRSCSVYSENTGVSENSFIPNRRNSVLVAKHSSGWFK